MQDEIERQLAAFGRTLATRAEQVPGGGPILAGPAALSQPARSPRRWALVGAAACLLAGVGALGYVAGRDDAPSSASPIAPPATATSAVPTPTTTFAPTTTAWLVDPTPLADRVAPDPLGLEADGWTLIERVVEPLATDDTCPAAAGLTAFTGAEQVRDVLTPPAANGLDVDITFISTGAGAGRELAAGIAALGPCVAASEGLEITTTEQEQLGAAWFRAGEQFALGTVVGEPLSMIVEIEGAEIDEALILDLVRRAASYLSRTPVLDPGPVPATTLATSPAGETTTTPPALTTSVAPSPTTTVPRQVIESVIAGGDQTAALLADIGSVLACTDIVTTPWPDSNVADTPAGAFYSLLEAEAVGFDADGRQHLPWSGWTELILTPTASAFVHEADGSALAVVMINAVADTDQWYGVESAACRSALEPTLG